MFISVGLVITLIASVQAACDNACSGHGTCNLDGVCSCYDNWGMGLSHDSGDCSDRVCPFEIAWIDTPDENGERHKYAECSGRGLCNRDTSDCECFPGYEGKACQRAVCPNACSGHGQCTYVENLPYQAAPFDWFNNVADTNVADYLTQSAHTFAYWGWDEHKTRGCVCDPEYADVDCSKRMCPYGNDIMDRRSDVTAAQIYHKQQIVMTPFGTMTAQNGNTFAITFKSKINETFTTTPIVWNGYTSGAATDFSDYSRDIKTALEALPNRVIDSVNVVTTSDTTTVTTTVEFVGDHVQGKQNLLTVRHYECGDGCTPKLSGLELIPASGGVALADVSETVVADYNSYECGRRGKCNYDTGICSCFAGYTGLACNTITALV